MQNHLSARLPRKDFEPPQSALYNRAGNFGPETKLDGRDYEVSH